jgi:hypothetical protein
MAERADITVNWGLSPRLIEVALPSVIVNNQDLHDTLNSNTLQPGMADDSLENMDDDPIIESAGKEDLGGGGAVGITSSLLNGQVAFGRSSPRHTTAYTVTTASATQFIASGALLQTIGAQRGDWILNWSDQSVTEILEVLSETTANVRPITGMAASSDDFAVSDVCTIWEVEECELSGGNVVAEDAAQLAINPLFTTFGRFATRASASQATTQELSTIERAAFEGGVWYDATGTAGTTYPAGTPGQPVNNLTDLKVIAAAFGFQEINLRGNLTFQGGDTLTGFTIFGKSTANLVTIDVGATVTDCAFEDLDLTGGLAGTTQAHDCNILAITGFAGELHNCKISTSIICQTGVSVFILDCKSGVQGTSTPFIDLNGTNADCGVRGYDGGIEFRLMTSGNVSVDLNSGHCVIANSNAGGTFVVRGTGKLTNNSGGAIVNAEGLSHEDALITRIAVESIRSTHQGYGRTYFVTPGGSDSNDGLTPASALATVAQAHTLCVDGGNDIIQVLNPLAAGYVHVEDIVITKNNVHLRATSRDITFVPATTGGTVIQIGAADGTNGYSCSLSGMLVDGDKGLALGANSAAYCVRVYGKFSLLDSVWLKQSTLDCLRFDGGDYHVINNAEYEKADRHGISTFDGNLPSGSPREISIIGRSNIYLNGGDGIHFGSRAAAIGSTTRIMRVLSADISLNAGYGIHAEANVDDLTIGRDVLIYNNTTGGRNILTPVVHDDSPILRETWGRLGLDPDNPLTTNDDNSISFGGVTINAVNGATSTTQTRAS